MIRYHILKLKNLNVKSRLLQHVSFAFFITTLSAFSAFALPVVVPGDLQTNDTVPLWGF
jgi:hypothetical protein